MVFYKPDLKGENINKECRNVSLRHIKMTSVLTSQHSRHFSDTGMESFWNFANLQHRKRSSQVPFFFFTACEARTYFTNILYSSFYFSSPFFFFLTKNVALRTNTTHIQPWQMKETITSDDGKHLQVTQLKSTSNPWWWRSEQVKMRRLFKAFVEVFPICVGCVRDGEGLRF